MKMRVMGTLDELNHARELLNDVFEVLEVSQPFRNRGDSKLYRMYVEAALPQVGRRTLGSS